MYKLLTVALERQRGKRDAGGRDGGEGTGRWVEYERKVWNLQGKPSAIDLGSSHQHTIWTSIPYIPMDTPSLPPPSHLIQVSDLQVKFISLLSLSLSLFQIYNMSDDMRLSFIGIMGFELLGYLLRSPA